jgi:CheY-like chemotaxis protein
LHEYSTGIWRLTAVKANQPPLRFTDHWAEKAEQKTYKPNKVGKSTNREVCCVLVVEDEPVLMEVCKRILTSHGFCLTSAMDGHEALLIPVEEDALDILLSEFLLPGDMSGFDIQREANLLQPGIGLILTTGYSDLRSMDNLR